MHPLIQFIYDNGLAAMFIIILLEYACFPISSEIVLPFSGAVAAHKEIPFLMMIFFSVIAGVIGTSICYAIGRFGGNALIGKITTKFPRTEKSIISSYEKFNHYGSYAVCLGRMIPLCRTYIAFIAGAAKQPFSIYLSYSFLGITIWNIILIGIGFYLGDRWELVLSYYERYKMILIPVLLAGISLLILYRIRYGKQRRQVQTNQHRRKS